MIILYEKFLIFPHRETNNTNPTVCSRRPSTGCRNAGYLSVRKFVSLYKYQRITKDLRRKGNGRSHVLLLNISIKNGSRGEWDQKGHGKRHGHGHGQEHEDGHGNGHGQDHEHGHGHGLDMDTDMDMSMNMYMNIS